MGLYNKFSKYYYRIKKRRKDVLLARHKRLRSTHIFPPWARRESYRWFKVGVRGLYRRVSLLGPSRKFHVVRRGLADYHKFGAYMTTELATWGITDKFLLMNPELKNFRKLIELNDPRVLEMEIRDRRVPFTTFNFQYPARLSPKEGYLTFFRQNVVFRLSAHMVQSACIKGFGWFQRFESKEELHFYFTRLVPNLTTPFLRWSTSSSNFNPLFLNLHNSFNLQVTRALQGTSRVRYGLKRFLRYERVYRMRQNMVQAAYIRYLKVHLFRYLQLTDRLGLFRKFSVRHNMIFVLASVFRQVLELHKR